MSETLHTSNGQVHFRGINFTSILDIDNQIKKQEDIQETIKEKIRLYSVTTPGDITPAGNTPLDYISDKVNELLEDYEDSLRTWHVLLFAKGIITDWKIMNPSLSDNDAFKAAYVDKYADIRAKLKTKI